MEKPISFQKHQQADFKAAYQSGEDIGIILAEALKTQEAEMNRLKNKMKNKLDMMETGISAAYHLSERAVGYMVSNDTTEQEDELWCYVDSINAILDLLDEIISMPD